MNVHLHIECLLIDSELRMNVRTLQASVTSGLSQALEEHSLPQRWRQQVSIASLIGVPVQFAGTPSARGVQLGRAVYSAMAGDATVGTNDDSGGRQP